MKLKQSDQAQVWTEAIRRCRLSPEAVAMARELGMSPRDLIKNIPAPSQAWKAPVEDWVRGLYAARQQRAERRQRHRARTAPAPAPAAGEPAELGRDDDGPSSSVSEHISHRRSESRSRGAAEVAGRSDG